MNENRLTILCLVEHYLPSYRWGGPVRTISNFVNKLGNEFDIRIICRDRDFKDNKSYTNIKIDQWNLVGKAKVFYASNKIISLAGIYNLIKKTPHHIIYLNSFFSFYFSIIPLLIWKFFYISNSPCLLGPRGEFSKNALRLKSIKKFFFIYLVKFFNFYKKIYWLASTNLESKDIQEALNIPVKKIYIAQDLISNSQESVRSNFVKKNNYLRIIFLSRISPMKNLDFLLKVLLRVKSTLELFIYGPKEDLDYWKKCLKLINKLPFNIKVTIKEELTYDKVANTFSQFDLFAFPTKGENFGHVIIESLLAGTPVLLSDKTFWRHNYTPNLKIIPLKENDWVKEIEGWANLSKDTIIKIKKNTFKLAKKIKKHLNKKAIIQNRNLFKKIINNY